MICSGVVDRGSAARARATGSTAVVHERDRERQHHPVFAVPLETGLGHEGVVAAGLQLAAVPFGEQADALLADVVASPRVLLTRGCRVRRRASRTVRPCRRAGRTGPSSAAWRHRMARISGRSASGSRTCRRVRRRRAAVTRRRLAPASPSPSAASPSASPSAAASSSFSTVARIVEHGDDWPVGIGRRWSTPAGSGMSLDADDRVHGHVGDVDR